MTGFPPLSVIDIVALVIVALGALIGYRRGLSGELAQLISVIVAFVISLLLYHPVGSWLHEHTQLNNRPQAAHAVAFIATIIGATIAMIILRYLLKRIMQVVIEKEVDKIGGVIAGFVRASILVVIVFLLLNMWPHEYLNRLFGEESVIGTAVLHCMPSFEEQFSSVKDLREKVENRWQERKKQSTEND
ncbi:MAG: CvpA family protein [Lentisphaerae bacterium]|nr:CvpA family protein [Lentisphaerota bacterium]